MSIWTFYTPDRVEKVNGTDVAPKTLNSVVQDRLGNTTEQTNGPGLHHYVVSHVQRLLEAGHTITNGHGAIATINADVTNDIIRLVERQRPTQKFDGTVVFVNEHFFVVQVSMFIDGKLGDRRVRIQGKIPRGMERGGPAKIHKIKKLEGELQGELSVN